MSIITCGMGKEIRKVVTMRVAICDDEIIELNNTRKQLEIAYRNLDLSIDVYDSGNELLKAVEHKKYNLIILDIEMPEIDGISLAKKIRETYEEIALCFLTSHVEYALKGYEVNALRYLTKPVKAEQLSEVITYLIEKDSAQKKLMLKDSEDMNLVPIKDVIYMEAQNQDIKIVTEQKEYSRRYNIKDYEDELRMYNFVRCHRSFLVNMAHVVRISKNEVMLDNKESIPLSRTKEKQVKEALLSYVKRSAI